MKHEALGIPCFPLPPVVEARLSHTSRELAMLHSKVDHIETLVLGTITSLLARNAVARVRLSVHHSEPIALTIPAASHSAVHDAQRTG